MMSVIASLSLTRRHGGRGSSRGEGVLCGPTLARLALEPSTHDRTCIRIGPERLSADSFAVRCFLGNAAANCAPPNYWWVGSIG